MADNDAPVRDPAPANETRGEVRLELGGVDYVLRPSYAAIDAFERATGKGLLALFGAASDCTMPLRDAAEIVAHCIRAHGDAIGDRLMSGVNPRRIGELIVETDGGIILVRIQLMKLLLAAAGGGYTASGEAKATAGTMPTPAVA
jgi:hypothetical protein